MKGRPLPDTHEIYPNAPLGLEMVAVEVRFPNTVTGRPLPMTLQRSFRDVLGENWVIETAKVQQLSVSVGPVGAVPQPPQLVTIPRFTVRDRTLAVALTDESMTIETTQYRHYPAFREIVERAATAAADVLAPDGITRIGVRYIDEIRVPDLREGDPSAWQEWVDTSLLPPQLQAMAKAGFESTGWEGAVQYETGADQKLVLRYGPKIGYVVNPAGHLKRPHHRPTSPGPLFALDFDCFWEPADIPEFDADTVMSTCDELRAPIRALFDMLTTGKLRAEFKREASVD